MYHTHTHILLLWKTTVETGGGQSTTFKRMTAVEDMT